MTPEQRTAARDRCEAATPKPWRAAEYKGYVIPSHAEPYKVAQLGGTLDNPGQIARTDEHLPHDVDFIAHARTDLPAALDEIDHLEWLLWRHGINPREADHVPS